MPKKLTVQDLFNAKGKRQLSQIYTDHAHEAQAAETAGVDMICALSKNIPAIREAAPNTFLTSALGMYDPSIASPIEAIKAGFNAIQQGADAIYCGLSVDLIREMANEFIPVVGHVGFVPYRSTWCGGARAIGKKADEALRVYQQALAYEDAGAIGIEIELVPEAIATEISKRIKILAISMGSGDGCDAQYLFAEDILGLNQGHVPRHAKQYVNLHPEMKRINTLRIDAFKAFHNEVNNGDYPETGHRLKIKDEELKHFLSQLPKT